MHLPDLCPSAIETVPELPDQFLLGPAEALVVDRDGEDTLVAPAIPFHAIRIPPLATVPLGHEPHPGHALPPVSVRAMA